MKLNNYLPYYKTWFYYVQLFSRDMLEQEKHHRDRPKQTKYFHNIDLVHGMDRYNKIYNYMQRAD